MPNEKDTKTSGTGEPAEARVTPLRIQATKQMIASNTDLKERAAPRLDQVSIIDDMYAFADRLRTPRSDT